MKQNRILFVLTLALSLFMVAFSSKERPLNEPFAVVELYTSQGCSSCPRADKVLEQITDTYKGKNVFALGFHVDYWDRLGWKDTFSKQAYSQRQYVYGQRFKNASVYTPQMIVNGTAEFNGGDKSKAFKLINQQLQKKVVAKLNGKVSELATKLPVQYTISDVQYDKYSVNAVLVKNHEKVNIKRGENSNRQIEYHNIVIDLKTLDADKKGKVVLEKPKNYNSANYTVLLFLQEKNNGAIIGAKKLGHS